MAIGAVELLVDAGLLEEEVVEFVAAALVELGPGFDGVSGTFAAFAIEEDGAGGEPVSEGIAGGEGAGLGGEGSGGAGSVAAGRLDLCWGWFAFAHRLTPGLRVAGVVVAFWCGFFYVIDFI